MRKETRFAFDAFLDAIAKLNGITNATQKFAVAPSVQQKLETRIQESSDFLKRVNIIGVTEQQGAKLGLGVGSPIASTTDTSVKDRETSDVTDLDENGYNCTQTNFDSHITYALLDAWAKFPDFQTRIRDVIVRRQALDRIAIGFNGKTRAKTSDRAANPLLQDVNKGWLQRMRDQAPQRVMDHGATAGKVKIGTGGDYANLDALVVDLVASMIEPWHQDDTALVVMCGRGLLHDKYFPLINKPQAPSEMLAADVIQSQKRIGNLPAVTVPFFPANAVLVTSFDNLSLYYQDSARRRTIVDNAKRDRIENFESSNDAYVVEDLGRAAMAENIEIVTA
ncbi:phage major capsid protein, P2 family [Paraburkholderia diazotrophica]|uniref:Phage major capsid protein, P2 family n=1 Tax=Paraburkholderia diazotrophica TaxID=667676 RepID=A0A1H7EGH1_9BURK|nr:phage major capsid protein, P2 family [Paraburkholderia diazotrophica]SEK13009.1 phage major capsid protein, P2 family [Paraburkholderia diazotrophica]